MLNLTGSGDELDVEDIVSKAWLLFSPGYYDVRKRPVQKL